MKCSLDISNFLGKISSLSHSHPKSILRPLPETEPASLSSPALAGGFFNTSTSWEAPVFHILKAILMSLNKSFMTSRVEPSNLEAFPLLLTPVSLIFLFSCCHVAALIHFVISPLVNSHLPFRIMRVGQVINWNILSHLAYDIILSLGIQCIL